MIIVQATDTTARKQAEREVRVRQEAIAKSVTPTAFGDGDFCITYVNAAFLDLFGFTSEQQVLGMPNTSFESSPTTIAEINATMEKHGQWIGEMTTRKLDGTPIDVMFCATLLRDEIGQPLQSVVTMIDITDRKRAELARETAQSELADRLNREKEIVQSELENAREDLVLTTRLSTLGKIAAQIAHDLRNPLGAVRNAAFYLKGELRDAAPNVREFVGLIEDEVATCDTIIRNLLEAARPREPDRRPVNVARVVESAFRRLHAPDGVELKLHAVPDPFYIDFDSVQCRQLMDNLMSNALHAVKDAGRIEVSLEYDDEDALMRVRDSGPGVSADARDSAFDLLFTTKAKGTGLGLVICRQIVEQHGGTIELESQGTGGASFLIRTPRHA